jgi:hypothetical protein
MKKKNTIKVFGIIALVAVIGMAVVGCGDTPKDFEEFEATTNGRLTIYGLSAHEGKEIYARGGISSPSFNLVLFASERAFNEYDPNNDTSFAVEYKPPQKGKVVSGAVSLKVFENKFAQSGKNGGFQNYTGNDQNIEFLICLDHNSNEYLGTVTVNFGNGSATGNFVPVP